MAIAILNSDVHFQHNIDSESDEHSSSSSSSSSSESWEHGQGPCYAHFDTRYAVGTHAAGWDEIKKFSSSAAHGFYVRFLKFDNTVKLGNKEWFDKEQIGIKEPFPVTYLPFTSQG